MREVRRAGFPIGVAGALLGLPPSTIRRWERAGIVTPARGARGWRVYSWEDLEVLRRARALVRRGVPLPEVRRRVRRGRPRGATILSRADRAVRRGPAVPLPVLVPRP